ncbi:hypothetical protein ACLOJK_007122 [Asimina triloba]
MLTRDDVEGTILAKQDLERALEEAKREVTRVQLQALDVEACIRLISDQAADASRLSFEIGVVKAEVATLRDLVVSLDAKEAELSSKLKSLQAEITLL